jgi:hypothetical protein
VSQAGLWLNRSLTIEQPIVRASPWPHAGDTWAPLGYRASPERPDAIVPLYSPGLPIAMALAQAAGGFCAAFLVVPLCGALTVWLTYALGVTVFGRRPIALAAALLVASSPIFLYQVMNPMTDVPVAAAWTAALVATAAGWPAAAGAASAAALVIRPNLAPVALILAGWILLAQRGRWLRFAGAVLPGIFLVTAINASIYESPLVSGYGTLAELYSVRHLAANLRQFGRWIHETQTAAILLLPLIFFAAPRLHPPPLVPHGRLLLGGVAAAIVGSYLFYVPFDAWWYLRFLLPAWPVLMLVTAESAAAIAAVATERWGGVLALAFAFALATNGVGIARTRYAFDVGRSERRYIDVARFVSSHTDADAVMIALQHSGTLRMYADRLTLRFDQLDPAWLDRAAAFLRSIGRHPYIVLEAGERDIFQRRFAAANDLGRLEWRPFGRLESADVSIYDTVDRSTSAEPLAIAASGSRRAGWRCDPPQEWPTPLRSR